MEKGSLPIKSSEDRSDCKLAGANQFLALNIANLNDLNNNNINHQNDNHQTKINSNRNEFNHSTASSSNFQTVKKRSRRELGNRGYIKKMRNVPFLGIFCAIMYAFFMSTSEALLKIVPNLHPIAVLVYRCVIQGGVFLIIAIYNQKNLLGVPGERYPVAGRAISGMMNQLCWYTSIRYISLTDSSAIYYSAPAFVTVLAFFMLGEKFGIYECASVIITLCGVTLVSKPGFLPFFNTESATDSQYQLARNLNDSLSMKPIFYQNTTNSSSLLSSLTLSNQGDDISVAESLHVYGMILAFIGAITFALSNIYVRQMKKTPTEITAFWFGLVTIAVCTPLAYFLNVMTLPSTALEWTVVCVVGVFSVLGQVAFTLALKIEKAGPVSVAQTLNIVIVLFYQIVFFHESITITSLVGVFLIILSVMIIGFKDMLSDTQLIKKTVKKLSKSSNGQFKLDNSLIDGNSQFNQSIKKEKDANDFIFSTNYATNYGIKVLPSTNYNGSQTTATHFNSSVCIGGNCKNNVCFNLDDEKSKEQEEQRNSYLNLQSYNGPPKYITYNKNDIY